MEVHLGDAVYIRTWNDGYELYTHNGIGKTNQIFLELEVAVALIETIKKDQTPK